MSPKGPPRQVQPVVAPRCCPSLPWYSSAVSCSSRCLHSSANGQAADNHGLRYARRRRLGLCLQRRRCAGDTGRSTLVVHARARQGRCSRCRLPRVLRACIVHLRVMRGACCLWHVVHDACCGMLAVSADPVAPCLSRILLSIASENFGVAHRP
ncbi:hypothetical protein GE09DRAFT_576165 [Coniochaeta sp. 2T2.1]|nr:hypothetical protein GE09DRAFT_576165 [Coniochaeta sp. 2T2.1]